MANMTADVSRRYKVTDGLGLMEYGLVGYTDHQAGSSAYTCYKGAVMMIDESDVDGYAQPNQSGYTVDPADIFLGICVEQVSVTASDTAQGDKKVKVATRGDWAFPVGSLTVTDIGALVYASDDGTLSTTVADNVWIGHIVNVDATYAWVRIDLAAGMISTGA
jgi:hypothetical protein